MSLKIAVIGAGSFVFGPSVLHQAIVEERLEGAEIALVDLDQEAVEAMAGLGRRMARDTGIHLEITAHTDRLVALPGAQFVLCSASPQMNKRFAMDREIIARCCPAHLVSEFGGVAGISYSLRQIALIEGITDDMKRLCPDAWLLDISNPLPRVCQAAHENGIRTAGFCSVSLSGYGMLWQLLTGETVDYPYTKPREHWEATMAGVNHLCWVVSLRDHAADEDLLPKIRRRLAEGGTYGSPVSERLTRETGYPLVPADDHTKDFLVPDGDVRSRVTAWHGSTAERQQRLADLRAIGEGDAPWDALLEHEAWEKPIAFAAGIAGIRPTRLHSLNLLNRGQIPNMPPGVYVETSCLVDENGPQPETVTLPETVLPYCASAAQVTNAIVRAAHQRSRALVHEAIRLDPTVLDKDAGIAAIDVCLEAHADLLPTYS